MDDRPCYCDSSWKMPRTFRGEDGRRYCSKCFRPRVRRQRPQPREDALDRAELELATD